MNWIKSWQAAARALRRDGFALYLALRHPQTPWYAKLAAAGVVAYALSPIDLIPDFIPVVGYLDDLILLPLAIVIVRRLIPASVMAECREQADSRLDRPVSRIGAALIIGLWIAAIGLIAYFALPLILDTHPDANSNSGSVYSR